MISIISLCAAVVRRFCGEPGVEAEEMRAAVCAARDEYDHLRAECRATRALYEVTDANLRRAQSERALADSQLLMVASELCGDSKLSWKDRSDPRWTPALQEAWAAVQKRREDAAQIVALLRERECLRALLVEWRKTRFFEDPGEWEAWKNKFGACVDAALANDSGGEEKPT